VIPPANNQVDFLLIIDNSTSMSADQQKLAGQMKGFADKLASLNIDWQMCVTTTTFITYGDGSQYWGYSIPWVGYNPGGSSKYVLKPGLAGANLSSIFTSTIGGIGVNESAGDERGLKSAINHMLNGAPGRNIANSGDCYRSGSAVAMIVLSDEDERSVGGDASRIKTNWNESVGAPSYTYRPLEDQDLPQNVLATAKGLFGPNVRFSFNSIVVDNLTCEGIQDNTVWTDSTGRNVRSPSHVGQKYIDLSNLTNGGVGSICNASFQDNLNLFSQKLVNTIKSVTLECAPLNGAVTVKVDGVTKTQGTDYSLNGAELVFSTPLNQGVRLEMSYQCN
jgi:hypothetical protein